MKILFIGGTGNISMACTRKALKEGCEVYVLNRGKTKNDVPPEVNIIIADINNREEVKKALGHQTFDAIVNFIAFTPEDITRDFELFNGKTAQYIFISSASAYQKPLLHPVVTESTPLKNPYWEYSRDKIACEDLLNKYYREQDFPITIVRPSLTYDTVIPVALGSWNDYTIIDRMKKGKPLVVHGDGTSLWTITHADDFAIGLYGLLGHQQATGHAFHITSDELLTWDQIYQAVGNAVGVKPEIVHVASDFIADVVRKENQEWLVGNFLGDKSTSTIFDNAKIKSFVPEYKATIPFKKGIIRTVEWFEKYPNRMVINNFWNEIIDEILNSYRH